MSRLSSAHKAQIAEKEAAAGNAYAAQLRELKKRTNGPDERMKQSVSTFLRAVDAWVDAYVHPPCRGGPLRRVVKTREERQIRAAVHFTSGIATANVMSKRKYLAFMRTGFPFLFQKP